eukprot:3425020-Amphidinium_carterae.1
MRHTGLGSTRFREGCGSSHWGGFKQHFKMGGVESCRKSSQQRTGHRCHDQFQGARALAGQSNIWYDAPFWLLSGQTSWNFPSRASASLGKLHRCLA